MQSTYVNIGLLAHVDAGKTTLSEALLYLGGALRRPGRVDHRNAFLDTDRLEQERGITIFSKQAVLPRENRTLILVDTPGHADFSSEMERTLQILDYAVLVINGTDGIQAHTETLWRLLTAHAIPTFLFINKMDLPGGDPTALLAQLQSRLNSGCVSPEDGEALAMCSEALMEEYLSAGEISPAALAEAIRRREVFPCFFGAALRMEGVEALLSALDTLTLPGDYPEDFSARVYKISRDNQGNRLTWLKVTGGTLAPKALLRGTHPRTGERWEEKAEQLRLYSGAKFTPLNRAAPGALCAVTGLTHTYIGQGLGAESDAPLPTLESVLTYQLLLPEGADPQAVYLRLQELEEEDPVLRLEWNSRLQAIFARLMGEVQLEVLRRRIADRFGLSVDFGTGQIVYLETIAAPVEGVGHFEPLRHYAEVHLLLEPAPRGSGIALDTRCPEDVLEGHWQRLILSHLLEKPHLGVLTGSVLTDVKITLLSGRAHLKHTEGGDFREATYRALRMGLMRGQSVLLEPWYRFRLELPTEQLGRGMADLQRFGGEWDPPETEGEGSVIAGCAPVRTLWDYATQVAAYSRGRGRLSLSAGGYRPCAEQDAVVAATGYRPEADLENTPDSVFCAHGGGFPVKWQDVPEHMHLPWSYVPRSHPDTEPKTVIRRNAASCSDFRAEDKALEAIYTRTYGAVKPRAFVPQAQLRQPDARKVAEQYAPEQTVLLVDGYNIIFAWEELDRLAKEDLGAARNRLIQILCNYQGFKGCGVILVFDAYKIKGGVERMEQVNNIFVVYTKQAEKADTYIERTTYDLGRHYRIRVATSDGMEQRIILGHNAQRISARLFLEEVNQVQAEIQNRIRENNARRI